MQDVWPSPWLVHYIHFGGSCPLTEFCEVQNSLVVQALRSPILALLLYFTRAVGISQTAAWYLHTRVRPSRWTLDGVVCFKVVFVVFYSREKYQMFQSRSDVWMKAGIGLAIVTTLGLLLLRYLRTRT